MPPGPAWPWPMPCSTWTLDRTRIGVLAASTLAGVLGYLALRFASRGAAR